MGARFTVLAAIAALAGTLLAAQARELVNAAGVIEVVNARAGWYAIVPDGDRGTRYAPDRLPDDFRQDGLRVTFSGRVGEIAPDERAWGIPLALTAIERAPQR